VHPQNRARSRLGLLARGFCQSQTPRTKEGDQVVAVDAPRRFEFEDGFADDAGNPNLDVPSMTIRVTLNERPEGGTRMAIETTFPSRDAMDQIIAMGAEEGVISALAQIDDLLRAGVGSS